MGSPVFQRNTLAIARKLAFTLTAVTLLAAGPRQRSEVQTLTVTADSIIRRYYRAVGGYDNLKAVESRRMTGSYSEGSMQAETEILWRRPMLRRVNLRGKEFNYSEGFDGVKWAFDVASNKLMRDKNRASNAGQRGAEFDEALVDYRERGHAVTLIGPARIGAFNTYRLRVRFTDGWEKDYLMDTTSFLIVAVRQAAPGPSPAPAAGSYSMYEDWRRVGRLLVPYRFVEKDAAKGTVLNTLQLKSVVHNVRITDADIRPPVPR